MAHAIDKNGLDLAGQMTWNGIPEEFVRMAQMIFGLPMDGPPPFWHLLELARASESREK